jgi:hypothetical protein
MSLYVIGCAYPQFSDEKYLSYPPQRPQNPQNICQAGFGGLQKPLVFTDFDLQNYPIFCKGQFSPFLHNLHMRQGVGLNFRPIKYLKVFSILLD